MVKSTRPRSPFLAWPCIKYIMKKMERKQVSLPPTWCSSLCKNSMQDVCVEECAGKRDCSWFEPKEGLNLVDMPRFPFQDTKEMTKEEKFMSVTIYLSKVVDHLKGVRDERPIRIYPRRPHVDRQRGSQIPSLVEVTGLLDGSPEKDAVHQTERAPDSNKRAGSEKVGGG